MFLYCGSFFSEVTWNFSRIQHGQIEIINQKLFQTGVLRELMSVQCDSTIKEIFFLINVRYQKKEPLFFYSPSSARSFSIVLFCFFIFSLIILLLSGKSSCTVTTLLLCNCSQWKCRCPSQSYSTQLRTHAVGQPQEVHVFLRKTIGACWLCTSYGHHGK